MRQTERIAMDETARLHPNEWSSLEVRILDFSNSGFRAECEAAMMAGSGIKLEIPGIGTVEAQVSWRRDGQIGAKFTQPVDLSSCDWTPVGTEALLARLLFQRAAASKSGLFAQEQLLRRQILESLPVHRERTKER